MHINFPFDPRAATYANVTYTHVKNMVKEYTLRLFASCGKVSTAATELLCNK